MFPYLRFELTLERVEEGNGPPAADAAFTAPLVRRVLGRALVARFCPWGEPRCEARPPGVAPPPAPGELCGLAATCPYGVLFASALTSRPPYALFCPLHAVEASGNGAGGVTAATLELTLYGPAWPLYPWALRALAAAFDRGLGRRRARWRMAALDRVRPDRGRERLGSAPPTLDPDLLAPALDPFVAPRPVAVELRSPARLLRDGRLLPGGEPVPFALLVARILDRFSGLYGAAASEVLRPEVRRTLEAAAARVPTLDDSTRWHEARDYSARQRTELLLGGKLGRVVYGPEAAPFLPLLKAGEVLHVGKNTASGCGRIAVDLLAEPAFDVPEADRPLTSAEAENRGRLAEGVRKPQIQHLQQVASDCPESNTRNRRPPRGPAEEVSGKGVLNVAESGG